MSDYRTERFYNRKLEFEMVERLLFSNKPSSERIVNFFGVSGSGKSWIINRLGEKYQSKVPCFLSTEIEAKTFQKLTADDLFKSIIQSLAERLEDLMLDYLTLPQQPSMEDIEDYLDKLLSYLEEQEQVKILLLIDNYDTWSPKLQGRFAQCILNRMLEYKCGLAVLTSRAKVSFEGLPALGFSMKPHELETFSDQIIAEKYREYRPIVPHILKITGGLPLCVENVFDYLLEQQITTVSEFFKYEEHLVKTIYEELIKERILTELEPDQYETICVLCIPRRFNVGVMSHLLSRIMPSNYQGFTNIDYLELIKDLGYFAPWDPSKKGFSIQKTIRQILVRYMNLFNPDIFGEVNKILLNMYEEKIEVSSPDMYEISEYLYHRLARMQSEKTGKIPEKNINREFSFCVETYFKQYAKREGSIDNLNALKETLETDDDLNSYITKATWKILERTIRS